MSRLCPMNCSGCTGSGDSRRHASSAALSDVMTRWLKYSARGGSEGWRFVRRSVIFGTEPWRKYCATSLPATKNTHTHEHPRTRTT